MMATFNLPNMLAADANNKHNAFCEAAKAEGLKPPVDAEFVTALRRVFGLSDFVARSCIRRPGILINLLTSGDLEKRNGGDAYYGRLRKHLEGITEPELLGKILRQFRLREMVRIAWRDLAGWADLSEVMEDLSSLADTCITQALLVLHAWQCLEFGIPSGKNGAQQHLVVIAMGKLGGRELNFSSDIDLIFAYPENGNTKQTDKSISNDEFFTRLCRRLLHVIGALTSDGIVFRADMRLRPYGESGPIVLSFDAMEAYYQQQGRDWERYAWIKARIITGDQSAGQEFMERIKPFVYRRYLDFGIFESLRRMKQKIELEEQRKGIENDIKLGPGGIREIEFFGQIFQLLRGGVEPALQQRNIQKALNTLARENHIPTDVHIDLEKAYIFLRNSENHLQEFSDQQTHILPVDSANRQRLAASLGFSSWDSYRLQLDRHLSCVHGHFSKLLEAKVSNEENRSVAAQLEMVWQGVAGNQQGQEILLKAGFDKPKEAMRLLDILRKDPATSSLSGQGHERLDKLIPLFLEQVGKSSQPSIILNRVIDLIKTIRKRTCYLALLTENPGALDHLFKLTSVSPWIVSFLTKHPVLLDELLDPRTLYALPDKRELEDELRKKLAYIPSHELEYQIEELCIFKQVNTLRVAAADVSGAVSLMRVSDLLSGIAETVVAAVVELSWNHLVGKYGKPVCALDGKPCERGFSVVAYGKLGGFELGYDSDLDLVFLHAGRKGSTRGGACAIDNVQFFTRLGQRVIHILTAHTAAGTLYETDMRLRPSGSSGPIVSHIEAFSRYQTQKAWTWEIQALVKARIICGDIELADCFRQTRDHVLAQGRSKVKLQQEVGSMRRRLRQALLHGDPKLFDLKQGVGGMVDIEFLVQFLVLLKSREHRELLKWTDNVRLLGTLAETGVMDAETAHFLRETYLTYRVTSHRLSLQNRIAMVPEKKFHSLREKVSEIWNAYIES